MKRTLAFSVILSLLLGWFIFSPPESVLAQSGTDVIREYHIDIQPQENGDLINTYSINWCVISDAAGPLGEIYVGMPNSKYEVLEFMGDIKGVRAANAGTYAQVLVSLDRYINAPECVAFTFTVRQEGIAHQDKTRQEIGFQFIPGWFDQVPVEELRITWALPEDETLVKSTSPEPTRRGEGAMVWETELEEGDKYTINLLYDQSAFPNFGQASSEPIWPLNRTPAASANSTETSDESDSSNIFTDESEPVSSSLLTFPSLGVCVCAVILVVLVIIIVLISLSNGIGGYRGGGYIGGSRPPSGGGWILGGGSSRSGGTVRTIPPSRSGGGGGLFGGRGSSCACVSCACACACAGGGRAGCSRKGFDISKLEMLAANKKKQP